MENRVRRGFDDKTIASNSGKLGGKMSRRPRDIKIGDSLTPEEILFMADGVAIIMKDSDCTEAEIKRLVTETSRLLVSGKWEAVFTHTLRNPVFSIGAWRKYLLNCWRDVNEELMSNHGNVEDEDKLKALKNISRAYDVALNTKTRWAVEARKLDKGETSNATTDNGLPKAGC